MMMLLLLLLLLPMMMCACVRRCHNERVGQTTCRRTTVHASRLTVITLCRVRIVFRNVEYVVGDVTHPIGDGVKVIVLLGDDGGV
jgi:hypothetical protein